MRLKDIGTAIDSVQDNKQAAWYNDKRGILVLASSASPAPTPSRWSTRSSKLLPAFREQIPPGVKLELVYDRSVSIRESVRDVQFTLVLALGAGGAGDLPVPAQPLGHAHPQHGAAHVHHRHLLGDVPDGLQPGQPLAAWRSRCAWASWWTTRSSCSRTSCATWRWASRAMQATLEGSQEIAFTILSMTHLARRGVHPGAVHGRRARAAAARVRRHHHRGHPGVGLRLADRSRRCCAAGCCARRTARSMAASTSRSSASSTRCAISTTGRCELTLAFPRVVHARVRGITVLTGWLFSTMPKGFLPSEDVGPAVRLHRSARRTSPSTRCTSCTSRRPRIIRADPARGRHHGLHRACGGSSQSINLGRMLHPPERPRSERPSADEVMQRLRPKLAVDPRRQGVSCRTCPPSASAARSPRASTSSRCRTPTPTSSTSGRRSSRRRCARCPGFRT